MYNKYKATWILDSNGDKTSEKNPGKTIPSLKRDSEGVLYVSGIMVYIHPSAFSTNSNRQTLIIGHEFIHVSHAGSGSLTKWYNQFGSDGARAISEYWSYKWQVDNEVKLGYSLGGNTQLDKWTNLLPPKYTPK